MHSSEPRRCRRPPASASPSPTTTRHRRACCGIPTRRCTEPRSGAAAASSCSTKHCARGTSVASRHVVVAPGARTRRVHRGVPAHHRSRDGRDGQRRSARTMGRSRARSRSSAGFHLAGRGHRSHRLDRRVGARSGVPRARTLAAHRAVDDRCGEPLGASVARPRPRGPGLGDPAGDRRPAPRDCASS